MTYYERNKEKCLAYQKEYNKINHDEYLEYQKIHYNDNKEQYYERTKSNRIPTGNPVGRPKGLPKPIKEKKPKKEKTIEYVLIESNKEAIKTTKPIVGYKITNKGFTFSEW